MVLREISRKKNKNRLHMWSKLGLLLDKMVYFDLVLQLLLLELVSPGALYTCGRLELHCVDQATIEGSSSTVIHK